MATFSTETGRGLPGTKSRNSGTTIEWTVQAGAAVNKGDLVTVGTNGKTSITGTGLVGVVLNDAKADEQVVIGQGGWFFAKTALTTAPTVGAAVRRDANGEATGTGSGTAIGTFGTQFDNDNDAVEVFIPQGQRI